MDDNFKTIYKILSTLEKSLDIPDFDITELSADRLGISDVRRIKYLQMLAQAGYISGISFNSFIDGTIDVVADNTMITIKGLEYLSENTIMQRIYKALKGIKDLVP